MCLYRDIKIILKPITLFVKIIILSIYKYINI